MPHPNDRPLEHTKGGTHTRDDGTETGVPMAPPPPGEPQTVGPEDAAGAQPTRGDYSGRSSVGTSVELIPEDEQVPSGPRVRIVQQGVTPDPPAAA